MLEVSIIRFVHYPSRQTKAVRSYFFVGFWSPVVEPKFDKRKQPEFTFFCQVFKSSGRIKSWQKEAAGSYFLLQAFEIQ